MIGSIALRDQNEMLILSSGTFKKIFSESFNQKYISMGLNWFSSLCNNQLSEFLHEDVIPLFNSSSVMVRRKAWAATYKLIIWYPDAIKTLSSYLSDALEDVSPVVQISAVSVMFELSRANAKIFLLTVPKLVKLFKSDNNWLVIKLIKLMHEIIRVEPRMVKKLTKVYQNLLITTKAKSVEIDLVREIITNFRSQTELFNMAKEKIVEYFDTKDNNLMYLGLSAIQCIILNSDEDTTEYKGKIVEWFNKTDITVRRTALHCIQSVVTPENSKEIVEDIVRSIEQFEFGLDPDRDTNSEESKKVDEEEEETLDDNVNKERVIKLFSDPDKSYRDLQIKTVLAILIDKNYKNVGKDFQWCIGIILKLGVYKSHRVNIPVSETLRQLFIKLDDNNKKQGVEQVVKIFLASVSAKNNKSEIKYSEEFLESIWFIITQNSFAIGSNNSSKILEYVRKHKIILSQTLPITKPSLCEMIFRLSIVELQNNIKQSRDADIFYDRLKLFKDLIIDSDPSMVAKDMRYSVYWNILMSLSESMTNLSKSDDLKQLLEQIADMEWMFEEEIQIGGSKQQNKIQPPDWLDEEFEIDESELEFNTKISQSEPIVPPQISADPPWEELQAEGAVADQEANHE